MWDQQISKRRRSCICYLGCHPEQSEGPASSVAVALAFLSVIPAGNLLFPSESNNEGGTNKSPSVVAFAFAVTSQFAA
jgi:hypothetical protein